MISNKNKNSMKLEVKKLCEKYQHCVSSGRIKNMTEEETKKDFILPLFEALGWDVYDKKTDDEVSAEEKAAKGFVDYGFRINGIPKFFLEAKSFKVGVESNIFAFKAINYSYSKGTTWAILTNFAKIRIFNAEIKVKIATSAQFLILDQSEFLSNFEQLYLLSRPAMVERLLDKKAEIWGRKIRKSRIDKQLLNDLSNFRNILKKSIVSLNKDKDLEEYEVDESVQRVLNRLIFIRTIEDRNIQAPILKPIMIEQKDVWKKIISTFKIYDKIFNSNLFAIHLCDSLTISDNALESVIRGLHQTEDQTVMYDFATIDTDVLGIMYEQYLGRITKSKKTQRRDQGIYYTPKYVVDYIVKNTVGRYIKESSSKRPKLRIIDPACGSGSFLLGALDYLISLDKDIDSRQKNINQLFDEGEISTERMMHVRDSIFGVDLDQQAVEITRLNLLLKVAEKKERLPTLHKNIQHGNSLFDDEKHSDISFDWENRFDEPAKFHAAVGNPPYYSINGIGSKCKSNLQEAWPEVFTGHNDILYFFHALGLKILANKGYLGFITSRYFLEADYAHKLRTHIMRNAELVQIIDFGSKVQLFEDPSVNTCIIIYKKVESSTHSENIVNIVKVKDWKKDNSELFDYINSNIDKAIKNEFIEIHQKPQSGISDYRWTLQPAKVTSLADRLQENSEYLSDFDGRKGVCKVFKSIESGLDRIKIANTKQDVFRVNKKTIQEKHLEKEILKPLVKNGMLRRYALNYTDEFLIFLTGDNHIGRYPNVKKHLEQYKTQLKQRYDIKKSNREWWRLSNLRNIKLLLSKEDKLFVPMISPENRFVFIKSDDYICTADVYVLILQDKSYDLRYIQGVLNSKLMNLLVKRSSKAVDGSALTADGTTKRRFSYSVRNIQNLPIKKASKSKQNKIAERVIKIEQLHEKLTGKQTSIEDKIQADIKKTDAEIESLVLGIYDMAEEDLNSLS